MSETDSMNSSAMQDLVKRATQLWWRFEAVIERGERWVKTIMAENAGTGLRGNVKCTDDSVHGNSGPVVINRVILSERGAIILAIAIFAGLAAMAFAEARGNSRMMDAQFATLRNDFQFTRNKVERLEIEVSNNNDIMVRAGLKEPADMKLGPAGNPNYPKRKP